MTTLMVVISGVNFSMRELSTQPGSCDYQEGIPVKELKKIYDNIGLYRKLVAVSILANTIMASIGVIYL